MARILLMIAFDLGTGNRCEARAEKSTERTREGSTVSALTVTNSLAPAAAESTSIVVFHSHRSERSRLRSVLKGQFTISDASNVDQLTQRLTKQPSLAFVEFLLPQSKGADLVRLVRERSPRTEVIVLSPVEAPSFAVAAVKAGAFGFITSKERPEEILTLAFEALDHREMSQVSGDGAGATGSRFTSSSVQAVYDKLTGLARTGKTYLIAGEIGTGRKSAARAVHRLAQCGGVMHFVDAAQPAREPLLAALKIVAVATKEDGATRPVHQNTLCVLNCERLSPQELVELGEIARQPVVVRLTNGSTITANYRVIAITTRSPDSDDGEQTESMMEGIFDEVVEMPPLRHRMEDLPALCTELAQRWAGKYGTRPKKLTADAIEVLSTYCWPGNILELSNLMERLALTCPTDTVDATQLPLEIHIGAWKRGITYREAMARLEREFLHRILEKVGGCRRRAAERLQLSYSTLKFRMRKVSPVTPVDKSGPGRAVSTTAGRRRRA